MGHEVIAGIILVALLGFLSVEKTVGRKQVEIRKYKREQVLARGEEWIDPEDRAVRSGNGLMPKQKKYIAQNFVKNAWQRDYHTRMNLHVILPR